MSPDDNKRIVRDFIDAVWRRRDLDALPLFWTETCLNHAAPPGRDRGLAAVRAYHEQFGAAYAAFSEIEIVIRQQIAEDDQVVTVTATTMRHTGAFLRMAPSGKSVSFETVRIDRLEDGRIAEHWTIANMAGLMQQLQN